MSKNRESSKDGMSPENITEHEPTFVKREPMIRRLLKQKPVLIPLKQEKLRKSGMTKV
jgi:hypothetical protein